MKNIKEQWLDTEFLSQNLTVQDVSEVLEYTTPWLKDMEQKFSWDYFVNDLRLSDFIDTTMSKLYDDVIEQKDLNDWELYPKQNDFNALWDIAVLQASDNCDITKDFCELIKDSVMKTAKEVLA